MDADRGEIGHGGVDVRDGEADRVADLLLKRVVVAHRAAALDAAELGNHAGAIEHRLDEGGLSAGAVSDERKRAQILGGIVAHG